MTEKPFAILRVDKVKTMGNVSSSGSHMARSRPTPNADPARTPANRTYLGSADPAGDVSQMLPALGERNEAGHLLRRKDSVLALEVMATTSPEWWETATPAEQKDWIVQTGKWIVQHFGKANVAHLQLHTDETTPHFTGFIVPRDPDTGALNATRWMDGKKKLSQMQTDYHAKVKHLGLERGIEGSKAKHQRVQRHYGAIQKQVSALKIEPPRLLDFLKPEKYAAEQARKIAKQNTATVARAKVAQTSEAKSLSARATAKKAVKRAQVAETELAKAKSIADDMRALPLPDVLEALGFTKATKSKWKAEGFTIVIKDDGKWYDFEAHKGKGGAIDLAMHAMDCDFKQALSWLADRFGPGAAQADLTARLKSKAERDVSQAVKERPPFKQPEPVEANWPKVREWLVETRGFTETDIEELHQLGDVYADDRRNAVFLARDAEGNVTGAELKGTTGRKFTGMALGSQKAAGGFRMGKLSAKVVYLVESAIDALSLYLLRLKAGEKDFATVSTAGTAFAAPLLVTNGMSKKSRRVCAYDADEPGDKAARVLESQGWERLRPEVGKDWNDVLRSDASQEGEAPNVDTSFFEENGPEAPKPR